jgi:hypothetical protein
MSAIPEDPRVGRQRALSTYLWIALVVTMLLAAATAVAPDSWEDTVGPSMVAAFIIAPIGRLIWLFVRWLHRGDRRYALAVVALWAIMAVALVLAH